MKLLFRLFLTILSFMLILMVAYLALPAALGSFARSQLQQQGFTEISVKIGSIGLHSAAIEHLQASSDAFSVRIQGLKAAYQLSDILSGRLDTIQLGQINVSSLTGKTTEVSFPDPLLLAGLLVSPWHEMLPARVLEVGALLFYGDEGTLSLSASGVLQRREQSITGEFKLLDSRAVNHQLSLEFSPQTGIDLQLNTASLRSTPILLNLKAAGEGSGLAGVLSLDLSAIAELTGLSQDLSGSLHADLSYYEEPQAAKHNFRVSATATDTAIAGVQVKKAFVNLSGRLLETGVGLQLEFHRPSYVRMNALKFGVNSIEQLQLSLPPLMGIAEGQLLLSAEQGAAIEMDTILLDTISIPKSRIYDIKYTGGIPGGTAENCNYKMQLSMPQVETGDMQIKLEPLQLEGICPVAENPQWSLSAETEQIAYKDQNVHALLVDCALKVGNSEKGSLLKADPVELGGSLACDAGGSGGVVRSRFRLNPVTAVGRVEYAVSDIRPDAENPLLAGLLTDWDQPFDIVSGSVSVKGTYRWWKSGSGQPRDNLMMNLDMRDAGGHYEGILFSGLHYADSFVLLPKLDASDFSTLSIEHIDVGIPLTQASAGIQLGESSQGPLPWVRINDLKLSVLDGSLKGNNLHIDLNADEQDLLIYLDGLDLAQIVELQQLEGLSATGSLDGTIPVTMTSKGVKVSGGQVLAREQGGHISYKPAIDAAEAEKSAPGSELVLQVLENLDYNFLNVDVDYAENGEMNMQLAIKGISPQVDAKRPIHFNLNLQQNVLTLLQGLRYAEGINNQIDNNVQKYFGQQQKSLE